MDTTFLLLLPAAQSFQSPRLMEKDERTFRSTEPPGSPRLRRMANSSAYVTFEPRPRKERPDLQFWGGTRLWVVSVNWKQAPRPEKSLDETYDLRWLDDHVVVFDRVADGFYKEARIWKAFVPR